VSVVPGRFCTVDEWKGIVAMIHSQIPWHANKQHVISPTDSIIGICYDYMPEIGTGNAQHIVHCVNLYPKLIDALETARHELRCHNLTQDGGQKQNTPQAVALREIEALLKKAEGEAQS
jgi:hypothetical protein